MQRAVNLFLGLTLATFAAACAETNREAETPATEVVAPVTPSEQPRALTSPPPAAQLDNLVQNPQARELAAMQAANQPPRNADGQIDLQAMAAQENAKTEAEANAREQAKWQRIGHDQDRRNTDDAARARLAKATERVVAIQNRSAAVQGKRRIKLTQDISMFNAKRLEVQAKIDSLAATGSDEWTITKTELEDALNELDQLSWRVEGNL